MQTFDGERHSRRLRFPRRWSTRLALVAALLAALAVPAAWASHQFSDVPNTNPHHDDISTIAGAGITTGCAPGLYCPDAFVRRDQMASFLRRGLGRGGRDHVSSAVGTTEGVVAQVALVVPGNGFVLVNAAADYAMSGGTCVVWQRVIRPTSGDASYYTPTPSTSASGGSASTLLSPVSDGAGTRIFRLQAFRTGTCTGATAFADINAVWVPFGSQGTNTLAEPTSTSQQDDVPDTVQPTADPEK